MQQNNIPGHLVPIWHRPWVIFRNKANSISVKRYQFPMVPALLQQFIHPKEKVLMRLYTIMISHSQQIVYLALP